ncbi:hypothetical protein Taro_018145 [Colocasia esculenta]|uniref:Uncharacterized protein n=1 Tax=Colocasia esculenta TaxID=4460 RepID=A0A843UY85_COLES|nr:hypothetical protein [Colocasia esculenta]
MDEPASTPLGRWIFFALVGGMKQGSQKKLSLLDFHRVLVGGCFSAKNTFKTILIYGCLSMESCGRRKHPYRKHIEISKLKFLFVCRQASHAKKAQSIPEEEHFEREKGICIQRSRAAPPKDKGICIQRSRAVPPMEKGSASRGAEQRRQEKKKEKKRRSS